MEEQELPIEEQELPIEEYYSPIYFKIGIWYCDMCGTRHHGLENTCMRCHRKIKKRKRSIKWQVIRDDYMP